MAGDEPAYRLQATLGPCGLPAEGIAANTTTEVSFSLASCDLASFAGDELDLTVRSSRAEVFDATVPIESAEAAADLSSGLWTALK